jgi:reverse gyrase
MNKDWDTFNTTTFSPEPTNNLTKEETTALKQLQNNPTIIIKPADKGSAIVIIDTQHYILEAEHNTGRHTRTGLTKGNHRIIPIITTYNSPSFQVATLIHQRLQHKHLLPLHTPILAFKRNQNLRDSLVSSDL